MSWVEDLFNPERARRQVALNLALVNLPKNTKARKVVELAEQFELYLYDGSLPELDGE